MTKRKVFDVSHSKKSDKWDLKERGVEKPVASFDKKENAVDRGRVVAKSVSGPSQLVIRKEDGKIQTEHTYKKDPHPPRG